MQAPLLAVIPKVVESSKVESVVLFPFIDSRPDSAIDNKTFNGRIIAGFRES